MRHSINCDYDESEPATYRGIVVADRKTGAETRFLRDGAGFLGDLGDALACMKERGSDWVCMSSIDNYVMDANTCEHMIADMEKDEPDYETDCDCKPAITAADFQAAVGPYASHDGPLLNTHGGP